MENAAVQKIAAEMNLRPHQVQAVLNLLTEGATVPFISRYRKEATGSLDEVQVMAIRDRGKQLQELAERRDTILNSLTEMGKLTPELRGQILAAETMSRLEDLYLPYRPKRRTRAMMAREKGLEPLAMKLLLQTGMDVEAEAARFVDAGKGVDSAADALAGARDILAEMVNEDQEVRDKMRRLFGREGRIRSKMLKGMEEEGAKYRDYFQWEEDLRTAPSHRVLAMRRGEKEKVLSLHIAPDDEKALTLLERMYIKGRNAASEQVRLALEDCWKRLLAPGMETEARLESKERADAEAIKVFADNLRQLLLAAPLGQKRVLAVDPGFRTGCKLVVLDAQGKLLAHEVMYPHPPEHRTSQAEALVKRLCEQHGIEAVAVGNGTAGRETESFLRGLRLPGNPLVVMVNESGASVYSASDVARAEFPTHDVTVRGAVSIGRRLMDPLAELVKIEPRSIGVGQYQHDVDQAALKKSLDGVVESCVNGVGVEVNTASKELLTYVSGLGPVLAGNIVAHREANGPFKSRTELKKVPRLGDKAFEQAAGFLRIRGGKHPLDGSAVHPERYALVDQMARDLGVKVEDLLRDAELRKRIDLKRYVSGDVGLPTLQDILAELARPGRDPREAFEVFSFDESVNRPEDLFEGMVLPGIVTNITKFGCFVDVGVHQDGLVHVSELANRFVRDPAEVVKVSQKVRVKVLEVDLKRKRISLSIKQAE